MRERSLATCATLPLVSLPNGRHATEDGQARSPEAWEPIAAGAGATEPLGLLAELEYDPATDTFRRKPGREQLLVTSRWPERPAP